MIFFCNFALIMRQRFFQPVISLLFATLLMTGCGGKGSVKPLSITLDSIFIDTTATLEKGDVCKVHLKLHLFKGPHAAALNDSLLRMGLLQPDYMALSYEPINPRTALPAFVRRLVEEQAAVFKRIRSREADTQPLRYELSCETKVLAGAGDGVIYIVRTRTADSTEEPLTWTVVRNITPKGHWIRLDEVYDAKDRERLPGEILTQLADDLQLDDTTAVRKAGYFVGINAYATDNFMLFDDSIRFVYVPGEIAPKAVNITLDR